jgi:hypothetical protein
VNSPPEVQRLNPPELTPPSAGPPVIEIVKEYVSDALYSEGSPEIVGVTPASAPP